MLDVTRDDFVAFLLDGAAFHKDSGEMLCGDDRVKFAEHLVDFFAGYPGVCFAHIRTPVKVRGVEIGWEFDGAMIWAVRYAIGNWADLLVGDKDVLMFRVHNFWPCGTKRFYLVEHKDRAWAEAHGAEPGLAVGVPELRQICFVPEVTDVMVFVRFNNTTRAYFFDGAKVPRLVKYLRDFDGCDFTAEDDEMKQVEICALWYIVRYVSGGAENKNNYITLPKDWAGDSPGCTLPAKHLLREFAGAEMAGVAKKSRPRRGVHALVVTMNLQ